MISKSGWFKSVASLSVAALGAIPMLACSANADDPEEASSAALSTCGNGTRDSGEQCDDGNQKSLDGCSASCQFEQVQRMNAVNIQFGTDSYCTANALGGAVRSAAQSRIQDAITQAVRSGQISILLSFGGLEDMSGTAASGITLGSFVGSPHSGSSYDGSHDLDWSYTPEAAMIGANGQPVASLSAGFASHALTAGPGDMAFAFSLGNGLTNLALSKVKLKATAGSASAPGGHAASEHLDPALKSFGAMTGGALCGNVSAASLAVVPVPDALQQGGSAGCSEGYGPNNSILDVFLGGCHVFIEALGATQPDQATSAPAAGAGAPYRFTTNSQHHATGCKDKSGAAQDLDKCLKAAGYSAFFKFTTDRVIVKNGN